MTKLRFVERKLNPHSGVYTRILQQYGEIEQPPNSTDGEGNPVYDGPTVEGWFDVPLVTDDTKVEPHG